MSGGILMGINKMFKHEVIDSSPWWLITKISLSDWSFLLCNIYFSPALSLQYLLDILQTTLDDILASHRHEAIVMGGDFNALVGVQGSLHVEALQGSLLQSHRTSLDPIVSARGSQLIEFCGPNGFILLNGRTRSDFPAQFTFCSTQGKSVIDLIWVNLAGANLISDLQVAPNPLSLTTSH